MVTTFFIINTFDGEDPGAFGFTCQPNIKFIVTEDNGGTHSTYTPNATRVALYLPTAQYNGLKGLARAGTRLEMAYDNPGPSPYRIAHVNMLQISLDVPFP